MGALLASTLFFLMTKMNYKDTLNLPKTDFPMKADLVAREPKRLEKWQKAQMDARSLAKNEGAAKFVLHDGPPFANGDVHIGTALNKILKDIIVKFQTLNGKQAPYVPGWDCHGLPIEFKVTQEFRKQGKTDIDSATIRKECEAYARKYIDIQREQFRRLGVFGDWENPYLTLNKEYEADELRLFADIVERGFVYRGKKPVYWSIPCRTALAEAEVEYKDHTSDSVFVKFPVVGNPGLFIVIWTTTPWTLPANLAVAYNSTFDYSVVRVNGEALIVSALLLDKVAAQCGWNDFEIVRTIGAMELAEFEFQHPFCNRTGKLYEGDAFVENTAGSGFVHIAPGHGLEDYGVGLKNGLPIYSPVDDEGCLAHTDDLPVDQQMPQQLIGKSILGKKGSSEANEAVLAVLTARNALVHHEKYVHSYPHCWRSKTPVIFRAMDQWFINVDHLEFRQKALTAIDTVDWVPDWGINRIRGAVESRPDWCISRQRTWGVPIPAFYDANGEAILDPQVIRNVADLFEQHGSNIWFEQSAKKLWKQVKPASWPGADAAEKSQDTLDVWIDSGSSSRSVLMRRQELHDPESGSADDWQADVYLEGSDQHRGWFQSSLLLSLAGNGAPPYKTVLTHGFMVDADREKISKSKQGEGGYEKPQTAEAYIGDYGADVVRLWVASQDFRSDIVVSTERIKKVGEAYRGIRNTLRYQLSNLFDFDPEQHSVEDAKLTVLDRWILAQFQKMEADVRAAYERSEFHAVYQRLSQFAAVELSAVYHDLVKDRLYSDAAESNRRRSTQTVLNRIVRRYAQLLSPILVFTADEAWEFIPGHDAHGSIHLSVFEHVDFETTEDEESLWNLLFKVRDEALAELEKARQAKVIGKSLEAVVVIKATSDELKLLSVHEKEFQEILNASVLRIVEQGATSAVTINGHDLDLSDAGRILVRNAADFGHQKCQRCWHWEDDIGSHATHPTICGRCIAAVDAA